MSEQQHTRIASLPGKGQGPQHSSGNGSGSAGEEARKAAAAAADRAKAAAEETARAGEEVARAGSEILRTNVETAQQAVKAGVETAVSSLENFSRAVTRTWALDGDPDGEGARQSAQNIKAASQAATALARQAQEASREWLNLAQKGVRTNLEAMTRLASCRTLGDVANVQRALMRERLQQAVEAGQTIADASRRNLEEARRAFEARP